MICHHLYRLFTAIICAERSDTETRFSPCTSVFPCQKHSSTAPHFFILHLVPLFTFSILCFSNTPVHCGPYRPIQSPSNPSRLRPFCAKCLLFFSMSANPLQSRQSYHFVNFLFSLFRPYWLSLLFFFCILSLLVLSILPHHLSPSYSINSAVSAPYYLLGCSASPAFLSFHETTHAPYNYHPPRILH